MAKRPGRKKRIGSIVIVPGDIKYFGGYTSCCDSPHYLTRQQLAELKIYYSKSQHSFKQWLIRHLQE